MIDKPGPVIAEADEWPRFMTGVSHIASAGARAGALMMLKRDRHRKGRTLGKAAAVAAAGWGNSPRAVGLLHPSLACNAFSYRA